MQCFRRQSPGQFSPKECQLLLVRLLGHISHANYDPGQTSNCQYDHHKHDNDVNMMTTVGQTHYDPRQLKDFPLTNPIKVKIAEIV